MITSEIESYLFQIGKKLNAIQMKYRIDFLHLLKIKTFLIYFDFETYRRDEKYVLLNHIMK